MLRIWGRISSVNVQKVVWCAEELGIAYERIEAGGKFGRNDTPEYLAMNPNGLVPVIDDDGFVLYESNAIVRYLSAILDAHLAQRRYLTGERFTIADVVVGCAAHRWLNLPIERVARPQLERWYAEIAARPAASQVAALRPLT